MSVNAPPKAAFLDRDGVINEDHGYVGRVDDFSFIPGAIDGMRLLAAAAYELVVVTNQSGIGRGFYSEADFAGVSDYMRRALAAAGVPIAMILHCPHAPDYRDAGGGFCLCRKPRPGMIREATRTLGLDLARSILVGDKVNDIEAGRAAGVGRCYLVGAEASPAGADAVFKDLLTCARFVVETKDVGQRM